MTELSTLLHELQAELQVRNNPERMAYAKLKPNRHGWPQDLYSDGAFHNWEGILRKYPNDLQTIHHLAIMHHARAFDLELSPDPARADADWRRALELWHRLWQEDAFWQELANHLEPYSPDPFPEIRRNWPEQLLQIHFDIAFDTTTKNYRSRQHIRLALHAPFPEETKQKIRSRAYEQTTSYLPAVVWKPNTLDSQTLEPALAAVAAYLEKDETFLPALTDLLSLLTKFQASFVQKANAVHHEDQDWQRHLLQARQFSERYNLYIAKLDRQIEQLESDILSNLYLWHLRTGQALSLLKDYEKAASYYYFAVRAAKQDGDSERQGEAENERFCNLALAAREYAGKGGEANKARARSLLENLQDLDRLSGRCLFFSANTYFLLDELEIAKQQCDLALMRLQHAQSGVNRVAADMAMILLPECQEFAKIIDCRLSVRDLLNEAQTAMAANRWQTAANLLEQAAELEPDNPTIKILQSQCAREQIKFDEARQNWQGAFKKLLNDDEE